MWESFLNCSVTKQKQKWTTSLGNGVSENQASVKRFAFYVELVCVDGS